MNSSKSFNVQGLMFEFFHAGSPDTTLMYALLADPPICGFADLLICG